MAVNRTARIVLVVLFALYCLFLVTVVILIIRNKIQKRRRQKKLVIDAGYKNLGSDVELAHVSTSENAGVQQLPTNDEGGEDLAGKPKLEFEGNPVYQLDGHDVSHNVVDLEDEVASNTSQATTSAL